MIKGENMDDKTWLYKDIAERTHGAVYIGVVGPVRAGKSTFINKFVQNFVLPNIEDENDKKRTIDELPQSSDGRIIMTTKPQFVPNEAVKINLDNVNMKVRLIDCVGYLVDGATGHTENDKPRLVDTPWSKHKIPFAQAATIGTQKVISDHSTIAVVLTCDGSILDIPRASYETAEKKIVKELKALGKPFVVVVNTVNPDSVDTKNLVKKLNKNYAVPILAIDVNNLNKGDIDNIMANIMSQFPIETVNVKIPNWLKAVSKDNPILQEVLNEIYNATSNMQNVGEFNRDLILFENSENFEPIQNSNISVGDGSVLYDVKPKGNLFYKVLSTQCGYEIKDDYELVRHLKELTQAKSKYDKIRNALEQVDETGYGIVMPTQDEMELMEPVIVKQGAKCGVKLRAKAPSLHILKVDVETEVSPIMGGVQQSEELAEYLSQEFEKDPKSIWQTNMFGKSLESLVNNDLNIKLNSMPVGLQNKLKRVMSRIVNEGKGGLICLLL